METSLNVLINIDYDIYLYSCCRYIYTHVCFKHIEQIVIGHCTEASQSVGSSPHCSLLGSFCLDDFANHN